MRKIPPNMDATLSFYWNNHEATFCHVLSTLRERERYTDATLACNGKFYPVHKLVLSTCSEYFELMFENTPCKHPVIVLKDIKPDELEALLSYMYAGTASVAQSDLSRLLKAAELLQIKGLAVPDEPPVTNDNKRPHSSRDSKDTIKSGPQSKRRRKEENGSLSQGNSPPSNSPTTSPATSPCPHESETRSRNPSGNAKRGASRDLVEPSTSQETTEYFKVYETLVKEALETEKNSRLDELHFIHPESDSGMDNPGRGKGEDGTDASMPTKYKQDGRMKPKNRIVSDLESDVSSGSSPVCAKTSSSLSILPKIDDIFSLATTQKPSSLTNCTPSTSQSLLDTNLAQESNTSEESRRLIVKLEEGKSEVLENRKLLWMILAKLDSHIPEDINDGQIPEGIPPLPLTTVDAITEINRIMQTDPSEKKQLVSYLKRSGGVSVKEVVSRVMSTLMVPTLAIKFNWSGQRGEKLKFCSLKGILGVIFEAVSGNTPTRSATIQDVETAVKKYLKYVYQKVPKPAAAQAEADVPAAAPAEADVPSAEAPMESEED